MARTMIVPAGLDAALAQGDRARMENFLIPLPHDWKRHVKRALVAAVGLERLALAEVRAGFESSLDPRAELTAQVDRLGEVVRLRDEEIRIKDARLAVIPSRNRPHYPPAERLAIVTLRSRTGWSLAETARRFNIWPGTLASWVRRLDEQGPEALLQTRVPVNRYDDAVTLLVHDLHQAAPHQGRRKKADILGRAGLHVAASTVRRMLRRKPPPRPPPPELPRQSVSEKPERAVKADYPHHVWHVDITSLAIGSIGAGMWTVWWPFALVPRWVLSWHIAVVVDHFSRALVDFGVFRKEPTAGNVCAVLDRAVASAGRAPKYIVTDHGSQFQSEYRKGRNLPQTKSLDRDTGPGHHTASFRSVWRPFAWRPYDRAGRPPLLRRAGAQHERASELQFPAASFRRRRKDEV